MGGMLARYQALEAQERAAEARAEADAFVARLNASMIGRRGPAPAPEGEE